MKKVKRTYTLLLIVFTTTLMVSFSFPDDTVLPDCSDDAIIILPTATRPADPDLSEPPSPPPAGDDTAYCPTPPALPTASSEPPAGFNATDVVNLSLDPAGQQTLADCAAQAAEILGLRHGPLHAEMRLNEAGAWILEVAGRSIGGLCSQTLRFGVDQSLEELILRQAVGLPLAGLQRESAARGVMMIPIPAGGLLRGVTGVAAAQQVPGIEEVTITARLHNQVTPLPEGDSYLGFIFARGDRPEKIEAALRTAHAHLEFEIEPVFSLQAQVG